MNEDKDTKQLRDDLLDLELEEYVALRRMAESLLADRAHTAKEWRPVRTDEGPGYVKKGESWALLQGGEILPVSRQLNEVMALPFLLGATLTGLVALLWLTMPTVHAGSLALTGLSLAFVAAAPAWLRKISTTHRVCAPHDLDALKTLTGNVQKATTPPAPRPRTRAAEFALATRIRAKQVSRKALPPEVRKWARFERRPEKYMTFHDPVKRGLATIRNRRKFSQDPKLQKVKLARSER